MTRGGAGCSGSMPWSQFTGGTTQDAEKGRAGARRGAVVGVGGDLGATGRVLPETPVGKYPLSCPTPVNMIVAAAFPAAKKRFYDRWPKKHFWSILFY